MLRAEEKGPLDYSWTSSGTWSNWAIAHTGDHKDATGPAWPFEGDVLAPALRACDLWLKSSAIMASLTQPRLLGPWRHPDNMGETKDLRQGDVYLRQSGLLYLKRMLLLDKVFYKFQLNLFGWWYY